ncbi:MAG: transporter [Acidobacteriota bacterium]|nr:transporter [Acidobacteriota bacterium]
MTGRVRYRFLAVTAALCWWISGSPRSSHALPAGPPPIQDNSFLIEEAYNQEKGVVQHIQTFERAKGGAWTYAFTQEWPVPEETHQLSFTVPVQRARAHSGWATGPGDVALNYRYQLAGNGEAAIAAAPRLTVLLPTGDARRALGAGGTGVQVSLPVSTVLSSWLVAHWNAAVTYVHSARNEAGDRASERSWGLGQSFVWLASPDVNGLVETVWSSAEAVSAPGRTTRSRTFLVSPGIRWAWNRPGGLQIVPGIAVPLGVGSGRGERSILLYLSFEHPFRRVSPG